MSNWHITILSNIVVLHTHITNFILLCPTDIFEFYLTLQYSMHTLPIYMSLCQTDILQFYLTLYKFYFNVSHWRITILFNIVVFDTYATNFILLCQTDMFRFYLTLQYSVHTLPIFISMSQTNISSFLVTVYYCTSKPSLIFRYVQLTYSTNCILFCQTDIPQFLFKSVTKHIYHQFIWLCPTDISPFVSQY